MQTQPKFQRSYCSSSPVEINQYFARSSKNLLACNYCWHQEFWATNENVVSFIFQFRNGVSGPILGVAMDVQIVIFLIFTSVTLIFNSIVIWFAYKAFANITTNVTETMRGIQTSDDAKAWLNALHSASFQAVVATGSAKEMITGFEPTLARAQSKFGYGLASVDIRLERVHDKVRGGAEDVQNAIVRPAHRIGATLSGVQEALQYLSGDQSAGDANSTRKR